jgi:hypothetical protein
MTPAVLIDICENDERRICLECLGERVRYVVRAVPRLGPFAFEVGPDCAGAAMAEDGLNA